LRCSPLRRRRLDRGDAVKKAFGRETVEEVQGVWTVDKRLLEVLKNVDENLADVEEKICAVFMRGWT
jgi:hypothetical protein